MNLLRCIIAAIALAYLAWACRIAWVTFPKLRKTVEAARRRARRTLVSFERPRLLDSRLRKIDHARF